MTDEPLIAKKLARIEECVADLRSRANVDALATDVVMQRFVEHTLQLAIQAALDVASHIVMLLARKVAQASPVGVTEAASTISTMVLFGERVRCTTPLGTV